MFKLSLACVHWRKFSTPPSKTDRSNSSSSLDNCRSLVTRHSDNVAWPPIRNEKCLLWWIILGTLKATSEALWVPREFRRETSSKFEQRERKVSRWRQLRKSKLFDLLNITSKIFKDLQCCQVAQVLPENWVRFVEGFFEQIKRSWKWKALQPVA